MYIEVYITYIVASRKIMVADSDCAVKIYRSVFIMAPNKSPELEFSI